MAVNYKNGVDSKTARKRMEQPDSSWRKLEAAIEKISKAIPREEWKKLPSDLAENLDHYIYGIPKK